jgi:hypothetical protein
VGVVSRGREIVTMAVSHRTLLLGDAQGHVEDVTLKPTTSKADERPTVESTRSLAIRDVVELHFGSARLRDGRAIRFTPDGQVIPFTNGADIRQLADEWILKTDGNAWVSSPGGCNLGDMFKHVLDPFHVVRCTDPTPPAPTASLPRAIAVVATHQSGSACFLAADGRVGCRRRTSPAFTYPKLGPGVVELSAGSHHVCARSTQGRVDCWGSLGKSPLVLHPAGTPRPVMLP